MIPVLPTFPGGDITLCMHNYNTSLYIFQHGRCLFIAVKGGFLYNVPITGPVNFREGTILFGGAMP